jgi:hypothetical protein
MFEGGNPDWAHVLANQIAAFNEPMFELNNNKEYYIHYNRYLITNSMMMDLLQIHLSKMIKMKMFHLQSFEILFNLFFIPATAD